MGILAVLGSALCFGTTGTTQQLGVPDISPLAVGAARLLCGSLFLFAFAYIQRSQRGIIRMSRQDLLICGFGVAGYQLTFLAQFTSLASQSPLLPHSEAFPHSLPSSPI